MLVIAMTGGIGSGKSTAARLFSALGAPVIDSDHLAREAVYPENTALQAIIDHFGKSILLENGELDRTNLRKKIFASEKDRAWLEHLLHPLIRQLMADKIAALKEAPYCLVQIPLLVDREPNPLIQRILLIQAEESLRKQRIRARDQLDPSSVEAIINAQPELATFLKIADDVIINNGSLDALKKDVRHLHQKYLQLAQTT